MQSRLPTVPIAHHRDMLGVGCPDGEVSTRLPIAGGEVRAQLLVEAEVVTLVKDVNVIIGEDGRA